MNKPEINESEILTLMWESHRDFIRRLLIGHTHNIDLADDLLNETYLKASSGISGYRGGDARAWLSVIAKNTFYSYLRQRYLHCETGLDYDIGAQCEFVWRSALAV